jgi:hypothetical protein
LAKKAKRSGKQIPQLGEQKNQSVPPLIVAPPPSPDFHTAFRADLDMDRELLDPRVIGAAGKLGMTIMKAKEIAARLNISLLAMLGLEGAPLGHIVEKYVMGGSDQA